MSSLTSLSVLPGLLGDGFARRSSTVAAFDVVVTIADASDVKTVEGQEGRDYTVNISYTPRKTTDPEDEKETVTVDKVMASLEPLTPEKLQATTGDA